MKTSISLSMFATLAIAAGCGGSGGSGGAPDAGMDLATEVDMTATYDLQPSTVPGTRVVGGDVALDGVTTDDHAILEDVKKGLVAVALVGPPMPVTIDPTPDTVFVSGKVVFSFGTVDMNTNVGLLTAWSAAAGAPKKLSTAAVAGVVGASRDGAAIAFSDHASSDGSTADLILAKADGTGRVVLGTAIHSGLDGTCQPFLEFAGQKLFFTSCPGVRPDGGVAGATIAFADVGTGKITTLLTAAVDTFAVDKAGSRVLVIDLSGNASVVSTSGQPALPIDSGVAEGLITADGGTVLYATTMGALKRATVSMTPNPVVLVGNNVHVLDARSPDEKWLQVSNKVDNNAGLTDSLLASATTPGMPAALDPNPTGSFAGLDPFTADSTRALFYTDVSSAGDGTLSVRPVAGGMATMLGTSVWLAWGIKGSTVVWNDHYQSVPMRRGRADIFIADVAKTDPPSLLVQGADADFFFTTAKDKLVFTVSGGTGGGLYLLGL